MKKILFTILATTAILVGRAQSDKYTAAMQKNLALLDSAKTPEDFQAVSASFERIGNAEKTQWLPFYYAAFAQTIDGFVDPKADKDAIGNKALSLIEQSEAINKNAENYGIKYMAYMVQLMVNPMQRYQTFGAKGQQALAQGLALDSINPRLYYLKGNGILKTPAFAGGGPEKAKPFLEKAVALFNTEKPLPLYPRWGKSEADKALELCK